MRTEGVRFFDQEPEKRSLCYEHHICMIHLVARRTGNRRGGPVLPVYPRICSLGKSSALGLEFQRDLLLRVLSCDTRFPSSQASLRKDAAGCEGDYNKHSNQTFGSKPRPEESQASRCPNASLHLMGPGGTNILPSALEERAVQRCRLMWLGHHRLHFPTPTPSWCCSSEVHSLHSRGKGTQEPLAQNQMIFIITAL